MGNLKQQLTSKVASIILQCVRKEKGRLTELSDLCGINRKEFNVREMAKMKLHRLLRLLYGLMMIIPYEEYEEMMDDVREVMDSFAVKYDFEFFDE